MQVQLLQLLSFLPLKFLFLFSLLLLPATKYAQGLKIMPLGNSITQGNNEYTSYRYPLWKKLIDAGQEFEYVGSHDVNSGGNPNFSAYNGQTYTNRNEGHWGWRVDQILHGHENERDKGRLQQWLKGYTPDVVLMHLGSNDVMQEQPVTQTIHEVEQVVREIRKTNPNVTILMAKLVPIWREKVGQPTIDRWQEYNAQIPVLAERLNTAQSPVMVVDQTIGFDPTPGVDTWDGIHPNASGEEKMAQRWFEALDPVITPLPVELYEFKGLVTQSTIQLTWKTASETNNDYFEVERSEDGKTFKALGQVKGSGSTSTAMTYTFTDKNAPAGTLYYRLKQVDFDGQHELSHVVAVHKELTAGAAPQVYLSRGSGQMAMLHAENLQPEEEITAEVYTLNGILLHAFSVRADSSGRIAQTVAPAAAPPAGVYLLKATTTDQTFSRKYRLE